MVAHHREVQILRDIDAAPVPGSRLLTHHLRCDQAHEVPEQRLIVAAEDNAGDVGSLLVGDQQRLGLAADAVELLLPAALEGDVQHFGDDRAYVQKEEQVVVIVKLLQETTENLQARVE